MTNKNSVGLPELIKTTQSIIMAQRLDGCAPSGRELEQIFAAFIKAVKLRAIAGTQPVMLPGLCTIARKKFKATRKINPVTKELREIPERTKLKVWLHPDFAKSVRESYQPTSSSPNTEPSMSSDSPGNPPASPTEG